MESLQGRHQVNGLNRHRCHGSRLFLLFACRSTRCGKPELGLH